MQTTSEQMKMSRKLRGLFLNTEAAICSIYESGKMAYDCLAQSESYLLDYVELSPASRDVCLSYDFYVFNYHWVQMGWLDTKAIKNLPGFKATIVLEMSQNEPFDCVSEDDFDAYLVLDPTCKHFLRNVHAFPRPLEVYSTPPIAPSGTSIPIIGTFGLTFLDKGFEEVVKAVDAEFEAATIRINVPRSVHTTTEERRGFQSGLASIPLRNNVQIQFSEHFFSKRELIDWCAQNTLNVFLYNRRVGNGLCATTDQAISSGRPLAVSTNPTFRHIHSYIKPYPYLSLKESIDTTMPLIKRMQEDWSPSAFASKFEAVLESHGVQSRAVAKANKLKLPRVRTRLITKARIGEFIPPIVIKAKKMVMRGFSPVNKSTATPSILRPYAHQALQSSSQFQEDLLIDFLLGRKKHGVYVDVGANDPSFNSNTERFYLRGWRGINIEPGVLEYEKIARARVFDINLNIAISEESGSLVLYQIGNDSSISTLDQRTALKMATTQKKPITSTSVEVRPLSFVLEKYLGDRQIDFLTIDAEGHDLSVIRSNDWASFRPTLVMIESNIDSREIISEMDRNDYLYIFSNRVNALFVDKRTRDEKVLENIAWGF